MKELEKLNTAARDAYAAYKNAVNSRTAAYAAWDDRTSPTGACEITLAVPDACRVTDAAWQAYMTACEAARKANAYKTEEKENGACVAAPA